MITRSLLCLRTTLTPKPLPKPIQLHTGKPTWWIVVAPKGRLAPGSSNRADKISEAMGRARAVVFAFAAKFCLANLFLSLVTIQRLGYGLSLVGSASVSLRWFLGVPSPQRVPSLENRRRFSSSSLDMCGSCGLGLRQGPREAALPAVRHRGGPFGRPGFQLGLAKGKRSLGRRGGNIEHRSREPLSCGLISKLGRHLLCCSI